MNLRVASTVDPVVLLHSVIWKRLTMHLPSREPRAVGEDSRHHHIDTALLTQRIETRIDTLIHKRPRANLNRYKLLPRRRKRRGPVLPLRCSRGTALRPLSCLGQKPFSGRKSRQRRCRKTFQKSTAGVVLEVFGWFAHEPS